MRPQARAARFLIRFQARIPGPPGPGILGGVKIFWGGPARIYISRHPQPPAKYIGFSEISKVTNCYRMLLVTFGNIMLLAGSRDLGYSGIMFNLMKGII